MARVVIARRRPPLATFTLASMTDIVLLLLIFFLLTSSFVTQFGIRVNVPQAQTGPIEEGQYVTVAVTRDGRFFVDGEPVFRDALGARLAAKREHLSRPVVVLQADRAATVEDAVWVMNVARALGMGIWIATEPERP
ncbi:MAG: biopolymer transporter ExbD [Bacteroidetes bacterium]|nr:biopolymer transporter ExbD [Rhodothermia bacterium]MCS7155086.1 biopolymer transporter ExbD [Bacteroidota bacterium]MCX7907192.1 biopolymer transporter ExbD [Bacteroidota bacterium]MDW8138737.1 biopolymer transporter ExbD [Bacteroidota bacterium]MDW8286072.1 biopolymer transporter ExbD [Bacteroidota bacterium]